MELWLTGTPLCITALSPLQCSSLNLLTFFLLFCSTIPFVLSLFYVPSPSLLFTSVPLLLPSVLLLFTSSCSPSLPGLSVYFPLSGMDVGSVCYCLWHYRLCLASLLLLHPTSPCMCCCALCWEPPSLESSSTPLCWVRTHT